MPQRELTKKEIGRLAYANEETGLTQDEVADLIWTLRSRERSLAVMRSDAELRAMAINEWIEKYTASQKEVERLNQWVNDLQSGMYINCVYCGHRYGPDKDTPVAMADILKAHIEICPRHPMSALKSDLSRLQQLNDQMKKAMEEMLASHPTDILRMQAGNMFLDMERADAARKNANEILARVLKVSQ